MKDCLSSKQNKGCDFEHTPLNITKTTPQNTQAKGGLGAGKNAGIWEGRAPRLAFFTVLKNCIFSLREDSKVIKAHVLKFNCLVCLIG